MTVDEMFATLAMYDEQIEVAFARQDVALMRRLHARRDELFVTLTERIR